MTLDNWWYRMPSGYTAQYEPCGDDTYWHLYHRDERINGGISEDFEDAQRAAYRYARQHEYGHYMSETDTDLILDIYARRNRSLA